MKRRITNFLKPHKGQGSIVWRVWRKRLRSAACVARVAAGTGRRAAGLAARTGRRAARLAWLAAAAAATTAAARAVVSDRLVVVVGVLVLGGIIGI